MLLIEGAEVYTPESIGVQSIVIAGDRIEAVGEVDSRALAQSKLEVETLDATSCIVTPALIDPHVHLLGGSGESGFASQTPEVGFTELVMSGITTVVGLLGTDTTTRTMPALLAKAKGLRGEGLSAFVWSGGYDVRPLTGSIRDDIVLLEEVIGAGEVAIADRRGVELDAPTLARLATDCYVAGTLTGKAGLLHLHVGDGQRRLEVLRDVLHDFEVQPGWLYPTHVERNESLMQEAIALTRRGMTIDVDVYEEDLPRWATFYRDLGGDPSRLTASSDAAINSPRTLLEQVRACVQQGVLDLERAFALVTRNTARVLALHDHGTLARGQRAHLLVLARESLELRHVIANGKVVVRDGRPVRGERSLEQSNREIHLIGAKRHVGQ